MDWTPIIVAVIAGAGSGIGAAWLTPFAQRRAQEAKDRTTARRLVIERGRGIITEANYGNWAVALVVTHEDWPEVRAVLPESLKATYTPSDRVTVVQGEAFRHEALADALDELERKWRLK